MTPPTPTPPALPGAPLACPRCGVHIGWVIERDGQARLHVGRLVIRAQSGACGECGQAVTWTASGRVLEALLQRMEKR